jgi:hypothetical protein
VNRRQFLRSAAIVAAGAIAADQLELLERLAPRRLYFAGFDFGRERDRTVVVMHGRQCGKTEMMERELARMMGGQVWVVAPGQKELFKRLTPDQIQQLHQFYVDRRPFMGRRLLRPVLTDRGFEEVIYDRAPWRPLVVT